MNKVNIIGWVAQQPEIHVDTKGTLQCSVMVAINRVGNVPDVVTLVASGRNAESLSDFGRGEQIGITGSIKTRLDDTKSKEPEIITEVLVESVDLGKKQENPLNDEFLPGVLSFEKNK